MRKLFTGGVAALAAFGSVITAVPASAQYRDYDREVRRDRDRDGRPDRWDRRDHRRDAYRHGDRKWRYYGHSHGYKGYKGRWRAGQRYPHWRERGYYVTNYRAYGLPAPWRGYRYYRDDSGDIVMVAITSGIIGMIIGGALADDHYRR